MPGSIPAICTIHCLTTVSRNADLAPLDLADAANIGRHSCLRVHNHSAAGPDPKENRYVLSQPVRTSARFSHVSPLAAIKIDRSKQETPPVEDEDLDNDDLCPVGCVREIRDMDQLKHAIEITKSRNALVVVDFYRTACGSCKYIEHGFAKLCKGEAEANHPVIFLKHNVMDEYEEPSEINDKLRIKVVPLFHFYRDGVLVASFPTRDKSKLLEAINKYSSKDYEHAAEHPEQIVRR